MSEHVGLSSYVLSRPRVNGGLCLCTSLPREYLRQCVYVISLNPDAIKMMTILITLTITLIIIITIVIVHVSVSGNVIMFVIISDKRPYLYI